MSSYTDVISGKSNDSKIIYEDDIAIAFLPKNASTPGEIILTTKKQYNIFEMIPDDEVHHISIISRKIADVCFETLSGQGTNILIQNGIPAGQTDSQFSIRIIPRRNDDGINFKWTTDKESESELESIKNIIYEESKNIHFTKAKKKIEKNDSENNIIEKDIEKKATKATTSTQQETDYRLDFLKNKNL